MRGEYFLDTNIFVYSFDTQDKLKQKKAQNLISNALADSQGIISSQVIQEFLNVAILKFKNPLSIQESIVYIDQILQPLCEVFTNIDLFKKAISLHNEVKFSFYDSLIIAAALKGGCKIIYTEDLQHGQIVSGMKILNPFKS